MKTNFIGKNLSGFRSILTITILTSLLLTFFYFEPTQVKVSAENLVSPNVVISQVYGGGGNTGSTYKNDFIELFNRGTTAQSLTGWSVQYASSTGTSFAVTPLTDVTLQPGQYYLVQEAAGTGGTTNLPAPDATGSLAMSASAGKVALVNNTTALSGTFATGTGTGIIDFVGYGSANGFEGTAPAPTISATNSDVRLQKGCQDTDQNASDFAATAVFVSGNPRNTSSALNPCGGGGGITLSINDVTKAEGNSGTTVFTFTVTLSAAAPTGGVTFDIATADNTATTAGGDYVANSLTTQTIAAGATTYTFAVTVNGDTTTEPNETFFVNVTNVTGTGVTVSDSQGLGTITNDDIVATPINQIQGSASTSPLAGTSVTTTGIVTARISNGFFIQTPDANIDVNSETSEGIFVFTSTAPPADAAVGNSVQVAGTVSEFIPSTEPGSAPLTELTFATTSLLSTGNTLPAPIVLTAAETTNASETSNLLDTLEEYEGMRVQVNSLTVVSPTGGFVNETNATATSNGLFFGVVTGVPRPFREPGIELNDPVPSPMPANVPRFDTNPERLRVDSDAQTGATIIDVTTGATITNLVGVLTYGFRTYTIFPDPAPAPTVSGNISAIPVPAPAATDLTVAGFNLERFFDTISNSAAPVLTATAFNNRLNKASLAIRNILQTPDVLGVIEVENLTTLQALATKINNDAVATNQPNPMYTAYLQEGNDVGGIDVGFLVKTTRITPVASLCEDGTTRDDCQFGKNTTFKNPDASTSTLNDRPSLRLRATVLDSNNQPFAFTVIVNHLRSLIGVDDTAAGSNGFATSGERVRFKRRAQAEYLANLVQGCQTGNTTACPGTAADERLILVGDFNAFQFNDGFVDSIGTIKGAPTPPDQVVLPSSDLVNPNLINLVDTAAQPYSLMFDGNAQALDHILITRNLQSRFKNFQFAHLNADFPEIYRNDPNRPERISDHDGAVSYFSLLPVTAASTDISGRITVNAGRVRGRFSVSLQDLSTGETQTVLTDPRGFYRFSGITVGNSYLLTPSSKRYVFTPENKLFSLTEELTDADFEAQMPHR